MWRTKYPMNPIAIPPWEEQNLNRLNEIAALNTNDHNNRDESKQKMAENGHDKTATNANIQKTVRE